MKKLVLAILVLFWVGSASAQPYTWQAQPGYVQSIQSQLSALKAAIPPAPQPINAGQFLVANVAGTGSVFVPVTGDCTSSPTTPGKLTCSGSSGTPFGNLAFANSDGSTIVISFPGRIAGVGLVPVANGGTGSPLKATAFNNLSPMTTLGDIIYENNTPSGTRLAGNTTSTKNFLTQTGTGSASAAPAWGTIASADIATALTTASQINTTAGATITTTGGTKPAATCSGGSTGVSVANGSTNTRGSMTTSSSASTNCTITWNAGTTFPQAPFCVFTDANASTTPVAYSVDNANCNTTSCKFDFASATSVNVNWACF